MKFIDHNGRLFGKISVLDVIAVLLVLVLAAAFAFKGNQTHTSTGEDSSVPITFQVTVQGTRDYVGEAVKVGDLFYDQDYPSGGALGKITAVEVTPGTKLAELNDGTMELVPAEGCVNLVITVEGRGVITERQYLINRIYNLGVNASRSFYTPYALFTGSVTAIL